jgi:hypothetical protein
VVPAGLNHLPVNVPFTRAAGHTAALTITSDAPWVSAAAGAGDSAVRLTFSTAALINRTSTATITASDGTRSDTFFVRATVSVLNVVALRDDPVRSRTYALHQDGLNAGAVVVFDPVAGTTSGCLTVGNKPGDLVVSADGAELLVICSSSQNIAVIDLAQLAVKETIVLPTYVNWGPTDTTAHLALGPAGVIYYTDGAWAPTLRVFDRPTLTVKQTLQIGNSTEYGFGGVVVSNDRTQLFAWAQYGWHAGFAGSFAAKYTVAADGRLTFVTETAPGYPNGMLRDPLNTPALISADGRTVIIKQYSLDPASITNTRRAFPGPVYSISPGAEIAATQSAIFETATGNKLFDLPVSSTVQAVTSDYARLVYFDATARTLKTINLIQAVGLTVLGRELSPAPGSIVLPPTTLRWSPVLGVDRYRVYLGESSAAVTSASVTSTEYRDEVSTSAFTLPAALTPGRTYFWRIDPLNDSGATVGVVYSFTVATIGTDLAAIDVATVRGHADFPVALRLTSATAGKAWTATTNVPWIKLGAAAGVTPATLSATLDARALEPGVVNGSISVSSSDGEFSVPVRLSVDPLALTVMRSDPSSALLYAISEQVESGQTSGRAYLLELDAQTQTIRRVVRVGSSATDLAIHRGDNRVYVTNWRGGSILGLNLGTLALEKTFAFAAFTSIGYGDGDAYRIAAGGPGRLIVEEMDQWIEFSLFDTTTGAILNKAYVREGGGFYAPGGRYYYHGENNSSGAEIRRFDTVADQFTALEHARPSNNSSYYGSRTVVVSDNGQRVFWAGTIYDANLAVVWSQPDTIYSATANGAYAFSETSIYDIVGQRAVLAMPVATRVSAFNATTGTLVVQDGQRVAFYLFDPAAVMPAPVLAGESLSATSVRLTWTDNSLEKGFTVQWRLGGGTVWNDALTVAANVRTATLTALSAGTAYEYRVKADALLTSSAWSNLVTVTTLAGPPVVVTQPTSVVGIAGASASFSVVASGSGPLGYQWRKGGAALTGATLSSFTITSVQPADAGPYDVVVTNSVGSVTSFSVSLSVNVSPVFTRQPASLLIAPDGYAVFTIAATGTPTPGYRWQRQAAGTTAFVNLFNDATYSGVGGATLFITTATAAMNGDKFRCVASNGVASDAISAVATLSVVTPPVITSAPVATLVVGVSGSFVLQASGSPAPVFSVTGLPTWATLNSATGVLSGTPPSAAGAPFTLSLTASNGVAPAATQSFTLNVQFTSGAPVITSQPVSQSVNPGATVAFSVVATGAAPFAYQWKKDGVAIPQATGASYSIASAVAEDAGRYTVVIINPEGGVTSRAAVLSVVPPGVTAVHVVAGAGYAPGGTVTISNTLMFSGSAQSLGWQVLLPAGWSYVAGGGNEGDVRPAAGAESLLEWAWTAGATSPLSFTYTLRVPLAQAGGHQLAGLAILRPTGQTNPIQILLKPDPLVVNQVTMHSADTDGDFRVGLFELTRVIELYNVRLGTTRTGCYSVATTAGSEDGFVVDAVRAGSAIVTLSAYHNGDVNRDGRFSLTELTRVIELFNTRSGSARTGAYHVLAGTEDGFAPGP